MTDMTASRWASLLVLAGARAGRWCVGPSTATDNRIAYGCINVPVSFYEAVVWPAFSRASGIAYVLPDKRPLHEDFVGLPDVADSAQAVAARKRSAAS